MHPLTPHIFAVIVKKLGKNSYEGQDLFISAKELQSVPQTGQVDFIQSPEGITVRWRPNVTIPGEPQPTGHSPYKAPDEQTPDPPSSSEAPASEAKGLLTGNLDTSGEN